MALWPGANRATTGNASLRSRASTVRTSEARCLLDHYRFQIDSNTHRSQGHRYCEARPRSPSGRANSGRIESHRPHQSTEMFWYLAHSKTSSATRALGWSCFERRQVVDRRTQDTDHHPAPSSCHENPDGCDQVGCPRRDVQRSLCLDRESHPAIDKVP